MNEDDLLVALNRSAARRIAWETRRTKYGARGHSGSYLRAARRDGLLDLVIRLHVEGVLSEGQVAKASGLDRVEIRRLADARGEQP